MKQLERKNRYCYRTPAAFRRLCVETTPVPGFCRWRCQPPSGGCVLKLGIVAAACLLGDQPPSGGCVLKRPASVIRGAHGSQPPSGGCVLKPIISATLNLVVFQPPSGGCVLKLRVCQTAREWASQPPSGGCVLKPSPLGSPRTGCSPAAFRRLCVETSAAKPCPTASITSRLQAAVC